jgi:hypothetical protein
VRAERLRARRRKRRPASRAPALPLHREAGLLGHLRVDPDRRPPTADRRTIIDVATPVAGALRDKRAAEIETPVPRLRFCHRPVLLLLARAEQVHDTLAAGVYKLCDQTTVATPPKRLRAHQAGPRLRQRCRKRLLPTLRAHASGVAAERCDTKTPETVLTRFTREPAAERDRVPVGDPLLHEPRGESLLVELRVVARAWKASNVYDRAHTDFTKGLHELFDRPRAVSDRPYGHPRLLRDASQRHGAIMTAPALTNAKPSGANVESM